MAITTRDKGTDRDNERKSWVKSDSRGEDFSAREVTVGNDSDNSIPVIQKALENNSIIDVKSFNGIHTDTQNPTSMVADETFTGTEWVDTIQMGHFLFVQAGIEDFVSVQLEWSDDGATPNGTTTDLENEPFDTGTIVYNVYFTVLNSFQSGRYVRSKIVNGSVAQDPPIFIGVSSSGKDSYQPLISLEENPNLLSRVMFNRSIITGKVLDANLNDTNNYGNMELTSNKSLKTQSVHEVLFKYATPDDAALPSGASITVDKVLNTESNVIDSGWLPVREFKVQDFHVLADQPVKVFLLNSSDDLGNNVPADTLINPTIITLANSPANIAARFYDDYFRVVICNDSGTQVDEITIRSTGGNQTVQPIDFSMAQTVPVFFPAPLTQSAIRTYNETAGTLDLLQSSPSGSMQVAITDRPSEVRGRSFVRITASKFDILTTQTVHYTVPVGKILYVQSIMVQYLNDQNQPSEWALRDDTTNIVNFLAAAKNVGGNAGVASTTPPLPEPVPFSTSVNSIKIGNQGTLEGTIFIIGYLEDE